MEIFGFGQRVDIKNEIYSTGVVTFFNSKGNEKFSVKLQREDFTKFWELNDFVTSVMKDHGREENFWSILGNKLHEQYGVIEFNNNSSKQESLKKITKQSKITDNIPQVEKIVSYATIYFKGNTVEVVFENGKESITANMKYRKSWSNKKYIDQIFEKSSISPAWDFRYGWEWVA
jgi:hypothetical protein